MRCQDARSVDQELCKNLGPSFLMLYVPWCWCQCGIYYSRPQNIWIFSFSHTTVTWVDGLLWERSRGLSCYIWYILTIMLKSPSSWRPTLSYDQRTLSLKTALFLKLGNGFSLFIEQLPSGHIILSILHFFSPFRLMSLLPFHSLCCWSC